VTKSFLERIANQLGSSSIADSFSEAELSELSFYWPAWARPEQLPPRGNWRTWLMCAGRGFG